MEITLGAGAEPVPGYRLVERLGRGGSGEVWKATGPGGFELALKFVCLAESIGPLELRALQIIKDVRHPHLLATFGAWQVGRYLIIAMELAERTLLDRFRETAGQGFPGIPAPEIHEHFLDAARGLDYLNEPRHPSGGAEPVGIQHRDVKPQNLLLVGGSVKVADFGLARILEHTQTSHTGSMTPAYAAPEFFKKQTSSQSDQYSLAVTYCHLRGGRPPFTGGMAEVMAGHLLEPPDLTMLPEGEREAAARALAKEPKDRWGSCRAFVEALRSGVRAQDRVAPTTGPTTPAWGTFRPGEAGEASSSAEGPEGSAPPVRPASVPPLVDWHARPEVHARRSATAMSDRGRKVLALSLSLTALSVVIVLGLWALGVLSPVARSRGTPGPTPVAPPSDTRPGGPVTSAPPEPPRPPEPMAAAPAPPPAPERAPALSLDVPASEPGSATGAAPPAMSGAAPGGGAPAPAPTAPPSQEPQPQRPQPQPRRDWTNSIGMKLARIEPGSFLMGSTDGTGDENEHPQHEVRITRPFYLGVTEVTQAQYEAVMDSNPSWFASTGQGKDKVAGQSTSQHPVENVSWLDAVKFCNKLSEMEGRKPFYEINEGTVRVPDWKASGYRLPTEAEWEYACGGDPADLNEHAWFQGNSGSVTHPVGKKLTNRFGLHDMHGNVWEWCWDAYDNDYYKQSPPDDPPGPSQASYRVFRGGCWFNSARNCRPANRLRDSPEYRTYSLGFRVAAVQE